MKLFLLDMGAKIYGDCIVVTEGDRKILIDGAHPGDWKSSSSTPSIPDQLKSVLGPGPFHFDLLIVTHCHLDHIGCLPKLIRDGIVSCDRALVADEKLGFPGSAHDAAGDADAAKVIAAMTEEPQPQLTGAALDQFLSDAVSLSQSYDEMLTKLKDDGTKIVRYTGPGSKVTAIEEEFSDFGLQVLGPTNAHLKACRDAIGGVQDAVRVAVDGMRASDAELAAAAMYRMLAAPALRDDAPLPDDLRAFLDRAGAGAARNDQSIVIKLGSGDDAVLLTGDMQLAKAEVPGLDDVMSTLVEKLKGEGPYAFVKLPHHASYNGFDETVLAAFDKTPAFGISTGRGDPKHPEKSVLELLESVSDRHSWARTDRNGIIAISFANGKVMMGLSRGEVNDTSPNTADDAPLVPPAATPGVPPIPPSGPVSEAPVREALARTSGVGDVVEVFTRIPHVTTRVTITIDVEPKAGASRDVVAQQKRGASEQIKSVSRSFAPVAGGGPLPKLLFVTNMARLAANIGEMEADGVRGAIAAGGQTLVDLANGQGEAIQRAARDIGGVKGVVIIGGYDVVPADRYDTLPPSLRAALGPGGHGDPDGFIVWSDQIHGDLDGDKLADVPVSRIPDGRSAQLVKTALGASAPLPTTQRFGLRNVARPFADKIYKALAGPQEMLVSNPTRSQEVQSNAINAGLVYFMLHGSDADTSRFWGEVAGGMLEAMHVGNVPDPCAGVIFAGCCWGALTVRTSAFNYRDGDPLPPLTPEQSIALSFLAKGARAFVGCTGAHYSPVTGRLDYFGAPMHDRFWFHTAGGKKPAEALFNAKVDYIAGMPHGRTTVEEVAIENKILRQFTCLGLGW